MSSAVRQGEQSVELADRSGDAFQRMLNRTTLADALRCASGTRSVSGKALGVKKGSGLIDAKHPSGRSGQLDPTPFSHALAAFREAEAMQKERQPEYPQLYSTPGYKYCELLLEQCHASRIQQAQSGDGERRTGTPARHEGDEDDGQECPSYEEQTLAQLREVRTRAETIMARRDPLPTYALLDRALDHLTLGRTWLLEAEFVLGWPRSPATGVVERQETSDATTADSGGSATQVDEQPVLPKMSEGRESFSDERLTTSEAGSTEKDSQPFPVADLLTHATKYLNESVKLLRQAGTQDHLPRGPAAPGGVVAGDADTRVAGVGARHE